MQTDLACLSAMMVGYAAAALRPPAIFAGEIDDAIEQNPGYGRGLTHDGR